MSTKTTLFFASLCCLALAASTHAQQPNLDLRIPFTISSEHSTIDARTGTFVYTGLQLTQGNISIEADEGRATIRDQQDGEWRFAGNVKIQVNNGHIECDVADLTFERSVLITAIVTGSPATFEMQRSGANDITTAEAGRLLYDVRNGVIEFADQARITESGNEISSSTLVYNILNRRIEADSSGEGEDRVRITYTPTNGDSTGEIDETGQDEGNQ